MNEFEFIWICLSVYFGTCLIWLVISYIYCHMHYKEFTIKEMICFGDVDVDDNIYIFLFPVFNTVILIVVLIVSLCCFIGYIFEKIGSIKLK